VNIKFVSNDYTFRNNLDLLIVKMFNSGFSPIVEFYLNNKRIYYYLVPEKETEDLDDLEIINKAVDKMREDEDRWLEDCLPYLDNIDKFILFERSTVYHVCINEFTHQYATTRIVEENNSMFTLYLRDDKSGFSMTTHLTASSRDELIETMDALARMIIQMLKPFREKQEMVVLNSFGTDYALQKSSDIIDRREYKPPSGLYLHPAQT